jgi:hypothetical protein
LKKNGVLLFAVPCGYDDEPAHTHNRHLHEWREDFAANGFSILESGQFDFNQNEFHGIARPNRRNGVTELVRKIVGKMKLPASGTK